MEHQNVLQKRWPCVAGLWLGLSLLTFASTAWADIVPGEYSASAQGKESPVNVTLSVDKDGKITQLTVDASHETPELGGVAGKEVGKAILEQQSLNVDGMTGATETSNAVKKAAAAALTQAGADPSAYSQARAKAAVAEQSITTDVVVVGGGASGTAAALAAAESGAKVLVVEKAPAVGGAGKIASGLFAVGSSLERQKKLTFTTDELFHRLVDYNHYLTNGPLTRAVVDKSASTVDWLMKYGVDLYLSDENTQQAHNADPIKWRIYHHYKDSAAAFTNMYKHLEEMGGQLMTRTTGKALLKDEQGRVVGLIAETADGGKLTVHAKAVIVATGGYGANMKMLTSNMLTSNISSLAWANQGEGVKMAWEAGAAKWETQSALLHATKLVGVDPTKATGFNDSLLIRVLKTPLLWLDRSGERFVDESLVYDTALWANAAYSVGGNYFIVVDTPTLQAFSKGKLPFEVSGAGAPNPTGNGDFVALVEQGVKNGTIYKGATLDELAVSSGMQASRLKASVERYNAAIKAKKDNEFGKKPTFLAFNVASGPYYALASEVVSLSSTGGVRVNEQLEATDQNMQPIPGLYVVGNNAGGFFGSPAYPPYQGLALGFAYNSGRIAGEHAAQFVKQR